jgi:hypothetical protein
MTIAARRTGEPVDFRTGIGNACTEASQNTAAVGMCCR